MDIDFKRFLQSTADADLEIERLPAAEPKTARVRNPEWASWGDVDRDGSWGAAGG
jgi:hypothetical protein